MTESEVRDILARVLPEPAATPFITRDAAVAAGRRALRRRRLRVSLLGGGAALTVALAAGVPMLAMQPPKTLAPVPVTSPSLSGEQRPTPNTTPVPRSSAPARKPTGAAVPVSSALHSAAVGLLPRALFNGTDVSFDDGTYRLGPFDVVDNGLGYFISLAGIVNGPHVGRFSVALWPATGGPKAPDPGCDAGFDLGCQTQTGPAGQQVVLEKRYWTGSPIMEYRVKVFFADGSSMNGTVTNESVDGGDPASAQAQPPMTVEELASLLTAPGVVVP